MSIILAMLAAAQAQPQGPRTGRYNGDIVDPVKKDVIMKVAMNAPEKLPAQKHLGLLILHHGFKGNEGNYIGGTLEALQRVGLFDQYVVIAGKSQGEGWAEADDDRVLRIIEWAKKIYPVDARRVFQFGSSNGAAFVGRFGWAHQDLVAGVVAYCGGGYRFGAVPAGVVPADARTEWYFVHGGNDNPENSGRGCAELKAKGYCYIFRQMEGYGHTDIWDGNGHPSKDAVDAVRDDWILWMHGLRHKEIALAEADEKFIAAFENKSRAETLFGRKPTYVELSRVGGPQAGAVMAAAFQSKSAGVRAIAAEACEKTNFGNAAVTELAKLLVDGSDRTQQAAIRALGSAANWRNPEAQEALCALAVEAKANSVERSLAVEGLGKAARLALLGNFEDKKVFWTLVQRLDDEDGRVRAAAFAALSKVSPDGFGYKPAATVDQRKGAVAKWTSWCQEKCGAP